MTMFVSMSTPSSFRPSTSCWTMSLGRRNSGMPYINTPPATCRGLVDGDLVAELGQIARDGQAGRACADNSDLVAIGRGGGGLGMYVVAVPIGDKALQAANADGLALDAADALAFTWCSCGQTRPQTAGSALDWAITL